MALDVLLVVRRDAQDLGRKACAIERVAHVFAAAGHRRDCVGIEKET